MTTANTISSKETQAFLEAAANVCRIAAGGFPSPWNKYDPALFAAVLREVVTDSGEYWPVLASLNDVPPDESWRINCIAPHEASMRLEEYRTSHPDATPFLRDIDIVYRARAVQRESR